MDVEKDVQYAARPDTLKHLRACRTCKLIKTLEQFSDDFCENCWQDWADGQSASSLSRAVRHDTAMDRTTTDFEGLVSMMRPDDSWVARWLRMKKSTDSGTVSFKPGLYAIALPGEEAAAGGEEEYDEDEEEDEDGAGAGAGAGAGSGGAGAAADDDDDDDL